MLGKKLQSQSQCLVHSSVPAWQQVKAEKSISIVTIQEKNQNDYNLCIQSSTKTNFAPSASP